MPLPWKLRGGVGQGVGGSRARGQLRKGHLVAVAVTKMCCRSACPACNRSMRAAWRAAGRVPDSLARLLIPPKPSPLHLVGDSQVEVAAASQQRQLARPDHPQPKHANVGVCAACRGRRTGAQHWSAAAVIEHCWTGNDTRKAGQDAGQALSRLPAKAGARCRPRLHPHHSSGIKHPSQQVWYSPSCLHGQGPLWRWLATHPRRPEPPAGPRAAPGARLRRR